MVLGGNSVEGKLDLIALFGSYSYMYGVPYKGLRLAAPSIALPNTATEGFEVAGTILQFNGSNNYIVRSLNGYGVPHIDSVGNISYSVGSMPGVVTVQDTLMVHYTTDTIPLPSEVLLHPISVKAVIDDTAIVDADPVGNATSNKGWGTVV